MNFKRYEVVAVSYTFGPLYVSDRLPFRWMARFWVDLLNAWNRIPHHTYWTIHDSIDHRIEIKDADNNI